MTVVLVTFTFTTSQPPQKLAFGYFTVAMVHLFLVGVLEHEFYDFPIILGMSSSQLTKSIIFQRGRAQPPTSNGLYHHDSAIMKLEIRIIIHLIHHFFH